MAEKKFQRSADKKLAGVCGGIAEYFDADPTIIRIVYVVLTLFTSCFPGVLLYIIFMFLMPEAPAAAQQPEQPRYEEAQVVDEAPAAEPKKEPKKENKAKRARTKKEDK